MATTAELEQRIKAEYPQFNYLLAVPELRQLLLDAVDPDKGFSAEEFQSRLTNTYWWRTTADSQRTWDALINADKASADRQVRGRVAEIRDMMKEIGFGQTSWEQLVGLADFSIRFGVEVGSSEFRDVLANLVPDTEQQAGGANFYGGSFSEALTEIKRMANQEYLVGIPDADAWTWAKKIISGDNTMEGMRAQFASVAKGKFSHLSEAIDQGVAPGTYFAPYRQMIAQEMDLGSESVDLMDPRWADVLSKADNGKVRPMTMSEAQQYVRGRDEWRSTSGARTAGASMANELLRTFGALA